MKHQTLPNLLGHTDPPPPFGFSIGTFPPGPPRPYVLSPYFPGLSLLQEIALSLNSFSTFLSFASQGCLNEVDLQERAAKEEGRALEEFQSGKLTAVSVKELLQKLDRADQNVLYYAGGIRLLTEAIREREYFMLYLLPLYGNMRCDLRQRKFWRGVGSGPRSLQKFFLC